MTDDAVLDEKVDREGRGFTVADDEVLAGVVEVICEQGRSGFPFVVRDVTRDLEFRVCRFSPGWVRSGDGVDEDWLILANLGEDDFFPVLG